MIRNRFFNIFRCPIEINFLCSCLFCFTTDGDDTIQDRQERALQKAKKRALSSSLMQELRGKILRKSDFFGIKINPFLPNFYVCF